MNRLLDGLLHPEDGCPWDLKQTARSVSEDFLGEVYELREALLEGDPLKCREEGGDLGFLLFFLGRLASGDPSLDFGTKDMLDAAVDKMVYRHPHVFAAPAAAPSGTPAAPVPPAGAEAGAPGTGTPPAGGSAPLPSSPEEVLRLWHALKRAEPGRTGLLGSVPRDLPALARCGALGARAGRAGLDWESPAQVRSKLDEELGELDRELSQGGFGDPERSARISEELGDCLAALANLARHLGLSAEKALQDHNRRFSRRVAWMEATLAERGGTFEGSTPEELDRLWRDAKKKA
jgi:ATP diphosphatase